MKNTFRFLLFSIIAFNFFNCESGTKPLPEPELKPSLVGDAYRTVIAYWIADNNASSDLSAYAISDFNEMMEGMKSVDLSKNHLVIYIETINDLPQLIHLKKINGTIIADTIQTYKEQNPLSTSVMTEILTRVVDEFPAENYGFIFASHADGWIPTNNPATRYIGDYRETQMDITDFCSVLKNLPHLDFILFDACYMQSIEVAYELKPYVDYIISSPTEIPGPGAPYQKIIPLMFADKKEVAIDIGRGYYEHYGNGNGKIIDGIYLLNGNSKIWNLGVSISVLSTSKLNEVAMMTNKIFTEFLQEKERINTNHLFNYGCDISYTTYYYDMDRLIRLITSENDDYRQWREVFDELLPYFMSTNKSYANRKGGSFSMKEAEGIYIYIPQNSSSSHHQFYQTLRWYNDGGWKNIGW